MAKPITLPGQGLFVAAIFHDAAAFERALEALIERGIDRANVSLLANHETVQDHFGGIPTPDDMAERPDTPRDAYDTRAGLQAAIDFIAETVAVVGQIGAAAVAYAVGGPVGVATTTSALAEMTVEEALSGYIDSDYHDRFARSVHDGGMICWVHVYDRDQARKVITLLAGQGGEHVHLVDLTPTPGGADAA